MCHICNFFQIPKVVEMYGSTEGTVGLINMVNKVGALGYLSKFLPILPITVIKLDENGNQFEIDALKAH